MLDSNRTDLLAYLQDYGSNSPRWVGRVDKWRLRRWQQPRVASAAESVAAELAGLDVHPGDHVGIHVTDGPLWLAAFFGILRCGAVAVPIDSSYPAEIAAELASGLELRAWVQDRELPVVHSDLPTVPLDWQHPEGNSDSSSRLPPLPQDDPDRLAEVVLTSGTSSDPHSVSVTHSNLRAVLDGFQAEARRYRWAIRAAPTLHIAIDLPLSHLYGQVMGAFLPVILSANVSFVETMPATHLAATLRRHSTWVLATVPHTLAKLGAHLMEVGSTVWGASGMEQRLQAAEGMSWHRRWKLFDPVRRGMGRRLIAVVSGGAKLDADTENLWRRLGYLVIQGYGLTEAAPLVTLNHPFRPSAGAVGKPLPGVEIKLGDGGEIHVRGRNVTTSGDMNSRVDDQGWLHTGDLGELDESGNLRFIGRRSDRVVTPAGVNIDVASVATELRRQPGVMDAVVMESPWGPAGAICAILIMRPGESARNAIQATNANLPDAARLRRWFIWPCADLPRTPTGKPRRGPIIEWLRGQHTASGPVLQAIETDTSVASIISGCVSEIGGVEVHEADSDVPLRDLLDSLQRVELAAFLEESFGLAPGHDLFAGLQTISQLVEILEEPATETDKSVRAMPPIAASPATIDAGPAAAEWRHWPSTRAFRWLLREALVRPSLTCVLRVSSAGLENLDSVEPPFLLACNHVSILDPLVLLQAMPRSLRHRIAPAAMSRHFVDHPSGPLHYRWGVLGLNLFPLVQVGDWRPTLRIAGRLADRGQCPLIYPEGKRSDDGRPGQFHLGVTVLSQELHLPIVPCATAGLHTVMPVGSRWPRRAGLRRPTIAVCFGEPIAALRHNTDRRSALRDLEARITGLYRQALAIAERK